MGRLVGGPCHLSRLAARADVLGIVSRGWHSACRKVPSLPISHVRSCPIHASRKSPRGTRSPQALELGDLPRRRSASGSASRGRLQNRVHRNRGRQGCSPQFLGWLSGGREQALREHINSERTGLPSIGFKSGRPDEDSATKGISCSTQITGLARPSVDHQHRRLHGAGAEPVQGLLARLEWVGPRSTGGAAIHLIPRLGTHSVSRSCARHTASV
jgi:hypothetical protein